MSQNTEQLYTGVAYSYIEYINSYLKLLNNTLFFSTEYLDEETFEIQQDLKEIFMSLPTLLSSAKDKEICAEKLLAYRPRLEQKYRCLNAYRRELHHLVATWQSDENLSLNTLEENGLSDEEINELDFEQLAKDCADFVFKNTDEGTKQLHASQLFPVVPIKITKDNFLYYVKKSMLQIDIEDQPEAAENLISILEQQFDGRLFAEYGEHFSDLLDSLESLHDLTDPIDCFEEADSLEETLTTLFNMLHAMYRMICTLSNLFLFDQLDFNALTELNASFFDLYHCMKRILEDAEDSDLLLESLNERLDPLEADLRKVLVKVSDSDETDPSFIIIQTYLSMDINSLFGFAIQKNKRYSLEVREVFERFIETLGDRLAHTGVKERKLRMQYFMGALPFAMSEQTFTTYIRQAFSNLAHPRRALLSAMSIQSILQEGGFFKQGEVENDGMVPDDYYDLEANAFLAAHGYHELHEEAYGHYEHDCNCGHSHDSHNCNCGHDHNDHDCSCGHHH